MKNRFLKFIVLISFVLVVFGIFQAPSFVFAQDQGDVKEGLELLTESGLKSTDVRVIVARIIQAFLGLLGTIAVCIVIYGGFVWMLAGGDSEKVQRAKRILVNGVIGLVIILASLAIVTFILNALKDILLDDTEAWCTTADDVGTSQGCYDCLAGPTRVQDLSNVGCTESLLYLVKRSSSPQHSEEPVALEDHAIRNPVIRMYLSESVNASTLDADDDGFARFSSHCDFSIRK